MIHWGAGKIYVHRFGLEFGRPNSSSKFSEFELYTYNGIYTSSLSKVDIEIIGDV